MSLEKSRSIGQRMAEIEAVVAEIEKLCGSGAGEQVEHLVQIVMDLHREALKRIIRRLKQSGPVGEAVLGEIAGDELVSDLLVLHELHPLSSEDRVRKAVEKVRPYLQSHGSDVEVVDIAQGSANLRMQGGCGGCPAMANSLKMVIESALYDAAPDITSVNIEAVAQVAEAK